MASTNDLKNGMVLDLDGQLWQVLWFQHHKPGKGNTVVRSKLKHVLSGKIIDKTFNSDTKVDTATVDRREMQYLYMDGDDFVFMDNSTFEQFHVSAETVGEAKDYMLENQNAIVATHEGNPLFIELPASVELEVTYTEPGLQGDRSTGGTKPATLETGKLIQVPLFITTGERIKVDTRDGSYQGRVN
ncbi:elongation factor P [Tessaracoccus flavus]|uniref:Elongation factor P n=1 Tax=Tessaracoccus flavus TaxID=1610493 RepID=A0A1Q2CEA5_9ACTN|nr:elongation factor P [Tessaracoccus flavus]AQP44454.1 elongation factor P [Tessaracoccus flavus]SDY69823.1 translation elongation factor P (EF-P) [Tessaracoccus flavus]